MTAPVRYAPVVTYTKHTKTARERLWDAIGLFDAIPDNQDIDRYAIDNMDRAIDEFAAAMLRQAAAEGQELASLRADLAHWKDCHGATADALVKAQGERDAFASLLDATTKREADMFTRLRACQTAYCFNCGAPADAADRL